MKFLIVNVLLFLIGIAPIFSQNKITVTVDSTVFIYAEQSLVIFSDAEGNTLSYDFIRKPFITEQMVFTYEKKIPEEVIHFTIIKEYKSSYAKSPSSIIYFHAMTKYDVSINENINSFKEYQYFERPKKDFIININGISSVEDVILHELPGEYNGYKHKKRKQYLKLKLTQYEEDDIYVKLKCNGEEKYRYLHIPNFNFEKNMSYEFEQLSNDFIPFKIKLIDKKDSYCTIVCENEDSQNKIVLHSRNNERRRYGASRVLNSSLETFYSELEPLIPADASFYNFDIGVYDAKPSNEGSFNYRYSSEILPKEIIISREEIDFEVYVEKDFFEIQTEKENTDEFFFTKNILPLSFANSFSSFDMSYWTVNGWVKSNEIKFVYPRLNSDILEKFKSLDSELKNYRTEAIVIKKLNNTESIYFTKSSFD